MTDTTTIKTSEAKVTKIGRVRALIAANPGKTVNEIVALVKASDIGMSPTNIRNHVKANMPAEAAPSPVAETAEATA